MKISLSFLLVVLGLSCTLTTTIAASSSKARAKLFQARVKSGNKEVGLKESDFIDIDVNTPEGRVHEGSGSTIDDDDDGDDDDDDLEISGDKEIGSGVKDRGDTIVVRTSTTTTPTSTLSLSRRVTPSTTTTTTIRPSKSGVTASSTPRRVLSNVQTTSATRLSTRQSTITTLPNKINQFPQAGDNDEDGVVFLPKDFENNNNAEEVEENSNEIYTSRRTKQQSLIGTWHPSLIKPGVLAGIIGGAVIALLCAVLLVMFIVYRLRRNPDQLEEKANKVPIMSAYMNANDRDLYA